MSPGRRQSRGVALLFVTTLGIAGIGCAGGEGPSRRFLSVGTGGTGGIFYPLGGAIASRLSLRDGVRQYTAEVTGGSVENVNRVASGEMDLGFTISTTVFEAYNGGRDFDPPLVNLRLVAPLYPSVTHFLAARTSPVRSVGDVRGRRISVGSPGSGTEQVARQVLEAYGLTYDDVEVRYLSFRESADALRDGAIDVAVMTAGYPASAVLETTTAGVARLIPVDAPQLGVLVERYPYYAEGVIPDGAYPNMTGAVATVTVMNWLVGTEALDSTVVAHVLDILADDRAALEQVHGISAQIRIDALGRSPPVPLHPATTRWWERRQPASPSG